MELSSYKVPYEVTYFVFDNDLYLMIVKKTDSICMSKHALNGLLKIAIAQQIFGKCQFAEILKSEKASLTNNCRKSIELYWC